MAFSKTHNLQYETLRSITHLAQAFMYTDKHGEVCPAGWKPGADTIIPDPKVLAYFTEEKIEVELKISGELGLLQETG